MLELADKDIKTVIKTVFYMLKSSVETLDGSLEELG